MNPGQSERYFPLRQNIEMLAAHDDLAAVVIHLNDTYRIEDRQPYVPGLARIAWLVKQISNTVRETLGEDRTLVLHSGDFLSPSFMNATLNSAGEQMVELLNHCRVDYALIGNHEFDCGPKILRHRLEQASFTPIASNLIAPSEYGRWDELILWPANEPFLAIAAFAGRQTIDQASQSQFGFAAMPTEPTLSSIIHRVKTDPRIGTLVVLTHMDRDEDKNFQRILDRLWHKCGAYIFGGHDHDIDWQEPGRRTLFSKNLSNCKTITIALVRKGCIAAPPESSLPRPKYLTSDEERAATRYFDATGRFGPLESYPTFDSSMESTIAAYRKIVQPGTRPDFMTQFERYIREAAADMGELWVRQEAYIRELEGKLIELAIRDARSRFKDTLFILSGKETEGGLSQLPCDHAAQASVDRWVKRLNGKLGGDGFEVVADFSSDISHGRGLDATDKSLRTHSTDFGNFIVDAIKVATRVDIALVNAGSFRADDVISPRIKVRDLQEMFLFDAETAISIVELAANEIRQVFEHAIRNPGVGGFLQVTESLDQVKGRRAAARVAIVSRLLINPEDGYQDILARCRNCPRRDLFACLGGTSIRQYGLVRLVKQGAVLGVKYSAERRLDASAPSEPLAQVMTSFVALTDKYIEACSKEGIAWPRTLHILAGRSTSSEKELASVQAARKRLREFACSLYSERGVEFIKSFWRLLANSRVSFERGIGYEDYLANAL